MHWTSELMNILQVYDNISFTRLGEILGLDPDAAESTARRMIEQGR
jgi:hypothetical protein